MPELDFQPDTLDFQPEVPPVDPDTEWTDQAAAGLKHFGISVASGSLKGSAGILTAVRGLSKLTGRLLGQDVSAPEWDTGGLMDYVPKFKELATRLDKINTQENASKLTTIPGQVVGQTPSAILEWEANIPFAVTQEFERSKEAGEGTGTSIKNAVGAGLERAVLGQALKLFGGVKNAIIRRGGSAATLGIDTALHGGTLEDILTQSAVGGILAGKTAERVGPKDIVERTNRGGFMAEKQPTELPAEVAGAEAARAPSDIDFQPETPTPVLPTKPLVPEVTRPMLPATPERPLLEAPLPPDLPEPQGPEAARIPAEDQFPIQENAPKQEIPPTTPPAAPPLVVAPATPTATPQPTAMRRTTALQVAHDAAKVLGMSDEQRSQLNTQLTGKVSMADMSIAEARQVAMELQKQVEDSGQRIPQVGPNAPNLPDVPATMTVGGATRPAKEILESAVQTVGTLHNNRGKEPTVLSATNGVQKEGLWRRGVNTMIGDNNLSIPALAKKIGGIFEGMVKSIMIDDYADGQRKYNGFIKDLLTSIPEQAKAAGVTPDDLRQMSRTQDPRYGFIRAGFKLFGKNRTVEYPFTLGGKKIKMTGGEMLDLYLSLRQENGIDHVKTSGIKMFGRRFLNVTEVEVNKINDAVNTNPKMKAMAGIMTKTATTVNNPKLNETFHGMEGNTKEDIATNDNYWHLTIDNPRTAQGKQATPMSFIDNPRVLKERTGGGNGALVIGDAFDKFATVEEAVAAYVGLAHPIRNMRTLLNYGPFIDAVDAKGHSAVRDKLITLLDRAQNPRSAESTGAQFAQPFMNGAYRGVLQFNLRPIMAEFMGEVQELALPDFTLKDVSSLGAGIRNPELVKEMLEHSPTAYTRYHYGTSSFELAAIERNEHAMVIFSGQHSDINKPSIMMKTTDALKLSLGWKKAKEMVGKETDLEPGSQEYWDTVDKRATSYWQETCPSWDRFNRSMNSSDPTIARQVFFMFRSYWEKACSVLNTANTKYSYSDKGPEAKKEWAKAYGATMASIMANAAVRVLISEFVWRQKRTLGQAVGEIASSPFRLAAIAGPYLSEAASLFIQATSGSKIAPDFQGDMSLPLEMINMAGKTVEDYTKSAGYLIDGEQDKAKKAIKLAVMNSVIVAALARGVPIYDIQRVYKGWIKPEEDAADASRSH